MSSGVHTGATLRDWFAINASEEDINVMMLSDADYRGGRSIIYTRQQARYRHADAMILIRTREVNVASNESIE
jgi:hypothetical protein